MNPYSNDLGLYDFSVSDSILDSFSDRFDYDSPPSRLSPYPSRKQSLPPPPPPYRHDGKSPLPLGMDWSHPPRVWEGQKTKWPHDPHTGWSYCVTIPSWILLPKPRGSEPLAFYRIQVGIQSPEGITSTRGVLRRFSEFLKLFKELKKEFLTKKIPPTPPKRILGTRSETQLEERRCSLEDWMERLLSDIELSRTATVANFLELEAAARSFFSDITLQSTNTYTMASHTALLLPTRTASDISTAMLSPSVMSDHCKDSTYEISEAGSPRNGPQDNAEPDTSEPGHESAEYDLYHQGGTSLKYESIDRKILSDKLERFLMGKVDGGGQSTVTSNSRVLYNNVSHVKGDERDVISETESSKLDVRAVHARRLSSESVGSDYNSIRASDMAPPSSLDDIFRHLDGGNEAGRVIEYPAISSIQFPKDLVIALLSEERHKMSRILTTMRQRLTIAKTDMEDLIVRFNQEAAVRQFLTTKVKDLEAELETTRHNCEENMLQSTFIEKERFTKMQWDVEELQRKCLETEVKLKTEQDERARVELARMSVLQERDALHLELDAAREQIDALQNHNEELEAKSKADTKVLVKEVKSLRNYQLELKQQLSQLMREKIEVERTLQKERQRAEKASAANAKLLRECEILRHRLEECSVNFLVEEEDKLIVDTASPSDAIDLLTTSDNRIGLLLAEAQLLAEDVEGALKSLDENSNPGNGRTSDDELRKMLTDTFIDNATLRKQVNTVIRCALNMYLKSEREEDEEDVPLRKTVLSKFLER